MTSVRSTSNTALSFVRADEEGRLLVRTVDANGNPTGGGGSGGDASAANQVIQSTRLGDVTEAAPASDTASSGLNGRLQRIAQRLTALIGIFPGLGNKSSANSMSVSLASDDAQVGTKLTAAAALGAGASGLIGWLSTMSTTLLAGLTGRLRATNGDLFSPDGPVVFTRNADGTIATETITDGANSYRATWTWTNGLLTSVTGWVKQ